MKLAGLAGGIGCGKSTVARCLTDRGAVTVDVDLLSRELQRPGQPVLLAMVDRWGSKILHEDGTLHRQRLSAMVFNDADEMAALHRITNDAMEQAMYERVAVHHESDTIVLLEAALLAGSPRVYGISGLLVVDAPEGVVVARLARGRGIGEADARARMANQPSRDVRLANADLVIDNADDLSALDRQIERAWEWLLELPDGRMEPRLTG